MTPRKKSSTRLSKLKGLNKTTPRSLIERDSQPVKKNLRNKETESYNDGDLEKAKTKRINCYRFH